MSIERRGHRPPQKYQIDPDVRFVLYYIQLTILSIEEKSIAHLLGYP